MFIACVALTCGVSRTLTKCQITSLAGAFEGLSKLEFLWVLWFFLLFYQHLVHQRKLSSSHIHSISDINDLTPVELYLVLVACPFSMNAMEQMMTVLKMAMTFGQLIFVWPLSFLSDNPIQTLPVGAFPGGTAVHTLWVFIFCSFWYFLFHATCYYTNV